MSFVKGRKLETNFRYKNVSELMVLFVAFTLFIMSWSQALASALADAKRAFVQGDLPSTVKILESNLYPKSMLAGQEHLDALGLYGITQFTLGNRAKAETAFKDLLRRNPSGTLDKRYILDPAIGPFFERLKSSSAQAPKSSTANKKSNKRNKPTPPPEIPPAATVPQRRMTQKIFSGIEVNSNAPRTTVFADGIYVGPAGQAISMEPGTYQLTVSAEGYETREIKIKVTQGNTTKLDISLSKPEFKPKPERRTSKSAATEIERRLEKDGKNKKESSIETSRKQKKSMNYNMELTEEKSAAKRSRPRKSLSDEFFREQTPPPAPSYSPPAYSAPAYPQPYQQPPAYQPPQPYPQVPQYQFNPQPQYIAPIYPTQPYSPPLYQQPAPLPPAYSYPQPDPYAAPPPTDYGAPNPYEEEFEAGDGATPYDSYSRAKSQSSGSRSTRRKGKESRNSALAILPFGVGQFQNGDNTKGAIFLLGEGGLLGYALYLKYKEIPDVLKIFEKDRQTEVDDKVNQEEIDKKEEERVKYIVSRNDIANYCLIGAGALYAIGVIDAFSNINSPARKFRTSSDQPTEQKKYSFGIQPKIDGSLSMRFSLLLD